MRTCVRTVQRRLVRGGEGLLKIQEAPLPPRGQVRGGVTSEFPSDTASRVRTPLLFISILF